MKRYQLINYLNRRGQIILILIWLVVITVYLIFIGVFTKLEAEKYIFEAQLLLQHNGLSAPRFIFYSPTIFVIYLSLKINAGFYGAFVIQAMYNLGVTLFFYRALRCYFSNYIYAFITSFLLIIFLPYSVWTVYLYTESIFYTNILLLIAALIIHSSFSNVKNKLLIFFALFLVIISRPLGILFILPVVFYFYSNTGKKNKIFFGFATLFAVALVGYISNIIFSTIQDVNITLAASQGCIVCGITPEHSQQLNLTNKGSQLYQLSYYIVNNFEHFARLGIVKCKYFFTMVRSYYSAIHNMVLLLFIIPVYILGLVYIFSVKQKRDHSFYIFQISSIALFTTAIMLQCDDYHNRFILSLLPILLLMAMKGLEIILIRYQRRVVKPPSPS